MGLISGKITGQSIGKNKDGQQNVRILQVQMTDGDDIRTVEMYCQAGEDTAPVVGDKVIIRRLGSGSNLVCESTKDLIEPDVEAGEKKLYSYVGTTIKAFIKWVKDGILELNGNADFAVRYTALETAFNQLKSDFDTHTQTVSGGVAQPPTASTADITPSKVETVKLP
jgi:hypothetical protein